MHKKLFIEVIAGRTGMKWVGGKTLSGQDWQGNISLGPWQSVSFGAFPLCSVKPGTHP